MNLSSKCIILLHSISLENILKINPLSIFSLSIIGDNIIYVYPDMETALIGRFENGVMARARPTKIIKERCR